MGILDVFKGGKKVQINCQECGKLVEKSYYDYRGKKKGAFEITSEKILCEACFSKLHNKAHSPDNNGLIAISSKVILAMRNRDEKELKAALVAFDKIFNKDIAEDWYTKANIVANLHKYDESVKCYDEALFLDTHYTKAWYRKGAILFGLKKYVDAIKCFDNVMKLDINNKNEQRSWYTAALTFMAVSGLMEENKTPQELTASERMLLQNYNQMLDTSEPNVVVQISIFGKKH